MRVSIPELNEVTRQALRYYGYTADETETIAQVLLYAQLRGNNQGIVKLIGKGMPKNPAAGAITVEKETKLSALLNGNLNAGMVVLSKVMHMAVEKAKAHGFGIVGMNHTHTSTGAIGFYADYIARQDLIGFVYAGSSLYVAAHGSYEPIFGTNPLAIGLPTTGDPIVLDLATSAMAYFGLVEAATAGRTISPDVAYDQDGNPTTDPNAAMMGALRSFDRSYKGSGLSLMVEALTGPLVQASFAGIGDIKQNWGNLIYAIDPELLTDVQTFKEQNTQLVYQVKNTKKLPGVAEIFAPGERGNHTMRSAELEGYIDIEDNLWNTVKMVAAQAQ